MLSGAQQLDYDQLLDVSGLNCPLPVLKSKAALAGMSKGQVLKVISTQADSLKEFPTFCRLPGFELVKCEETATQYFYWIQKVI
ncbi:MAG: sulfurtransferase TusA family protein [Candidatus Sedimenticola sp. (ex Thyasira tokunagai)]